MSILKTTHDRASDRARQATKRARRIAAGVCVDCGAPRAPGDTRFCAAHRERYRKRAKTHRKADPRRYFVGHRVEHTEPLPTDSRPLVVCLTCCDLPWHRPLGGCPNCRRPWRPLERVRPTDTAAAREYSRCP